MNILQICNKPPYPPKDGGSIAMLNLTKGLSLLGCKITVIAMNPQKHFSSVKNIPADFKKNIDFHYINIDTSVHILKLIKNLLFSCLPYNAERFITKKFKSELENILLKNKFDIIQLEGLYLTPYIKTIHKYSEAKIVLRAHNIEYKIWERIAKNEKNPFKKCYLSVLKKRIKKFEKNAINRYDLLVPISKNDAQIFSELGNKKTIHICQSGIVTEELSRIKTEPDLFSVFYIGSLDWIPNQEALMWFIKKVWPKIINIHTDIFFYVAGRNAPQWFSDKLNAKNIIFKGEIDNSYDFISSKGIMVVPLFSGSGIRVKIIEGMALGKPVVTTTIGAEGINVTNDENILIADTVNDFSQHILNLLSDKSFYNQISNNAKKFINRNFNNNKITSDLLKFYEVVTFLKDVLLCLG